MHALCIVARRYVKATQIWRTPCTTLFISVCMDEPLVSCMVIYFYVYVLEWQLVCKFGTVERNVLLISCFYSCLFYITYVLSMFLSYFFLFWTLHWRHNDRDGVSNHQPHGCLLKCLFRRRSKKTSKLRVTGLCAENSPVTDEFPAQRASNAENVSIWWRHHEISVLY